jgi:luciferase family oxidoreductase group 1
MRLSVLDQSPIAEGSTGADALRNTIDLARLAESLGYHRYWLAEHHGTPMLAGAAPEVLIAAVAGATERIRVGSGGVMLPHYSPLKVAEVFSILCGLHPGRIDLGLGRAPGSDQNTMYALRRDPMSADRFPQDVLELQAYLAGETRVAGVDAIPGKGSRVPLYILGSSMFGATLAAALGLPYAFASHFAPAMLEPAVAAYRQEFKPSEQLDRPYVIAGVNVVAADTAEEAHGNLAAVRRNLAVGLFGRGRQLTDQQAEELLAQGAGQHVGQMLTHTAVGTRAEIGDFIDRFRKLADADELIVAHQAPTVEARLRSVTLLAEALEQPAA